MRSFKSSKVFRIVFNSSNRRRIVHNTLKVRVRDTEKTSLEKVRYEFNVVGLDS